MRVPSGWGFPEHCGFFHSRVTARARGRLCLGRQRGPEPSVQGGQRAVVVLQALSPPRPHLSPGDPPNPHRAGHTPGGSEPVGAGTPSPSTLNSASPGSSKL